MSLPAAYGQDQDAQAPQDNLRIIASPMVGFEISVPYGWQIFLNEKLRNGPLLKIQATDRAGTAIPANINLIYEQAAAGQTLQPLPEPEDYARIWKSQFDQQDITVELISVQPVEWQGYRGIRVEYRQLYENFTVQGVQFNFVADDGKDRFIVSYGTLDTLWEGDAPHLQAIADSIRFTREQAPAEEE